MRRRRLLVGLLAAVGAVSIGLAVSELLETGDERAARTPVGERAALLVVDQQLGGTAFFSEGAFPYIKLESAGGRIIAERLLRDTRLVLPLLRLQLEPGAYRLVSYQRPCDGGCPRQGVRGLDPPTPPCAATFEIAPERTLLALIRRRGDRGCRIVVGERVGRTLAHERAFDTCRRAAGGRHHSLRYWARVWGAERTRPEEVGAAYAERTFRGFEAWIRQAAVAGCMEGIDTVSHPIRFRLEDSYGVGDTIDVAITNVGTRPYMFEVYYQACFLSYFDSSGRRFIIPPGTHCDIRGEQIIRPGETKQLFTWRLDECVKDLWGCVRSRTLPPGTYTIKGRFKPEVGGTPVRAETTFEIVAA